MCKLPIYIFNIGAHPERNIMSQGVINTHLQKEYTTGNNTQVITNKDLFDGLYQKMFDIADDLFGGVQLLENNKRTCWAYVTNKDFYRGGIHEHTRTSVVNSVYYLQVPETKSYREGGISFYNGEDQEVFCYKPKVGDLLIFPNYLKHQPHQSHTEDFRIAINMEIMCNPVDWD